MSGNTSDRAKSDLKVDAIAEDLFGLNIRGVTSVYTLWRRPKRYFEAAKSLDWQDRFTPSIRLWLSFFALVSALKFWWIGNNDGMIGAFASGFAEAGIMLPEGVTYRDIGREAVTWIFGLIPILQIISMILLSMVYGFWGERTTLALRQRYLFSVMIPSASLMPLFVTIMVFIPQSMVGIYGGMLALITLIVDYQTGYRGGFQSVSGLRRVWRAGLLALILVLINTVMSIGAQIAGIIMISGKYGVMPPG